MTLSEGIRLGAMLKPHGVHFLLWEGRTCALGAAAEAAGVRLKPRQTVITDDMCEVYPILAAESRQICPACDSSRPGVASVVVHLNDIHYWTREQIADHVETIELPQKPVETPVLVAVP